MRYLSAVLLSVLFFFSVGLFALAQAAAPVVSVRSSDGMIIINGTPTLLFGVYHDSAQVSDQGQNLVDDLNTISGGGFNVMHPAITELQNTVGYRAQAPLKNMWTIASFYKPALTATVTALKDDGSVIMYDIADDFSSPIGNPSQSPVSVKLLHNAVKAVNPHMLTFGAAGAEPVYHNEQWVGSMDVIALETYPIGNLSGPFKTELENNIGDYIYYRKTMPPGQAIFALPQTFAWPGKRFATPQEIRNMTYAALIAHMNGIVYYSFGAASWTFGSVGRLPTSNAPLWAELKLLKADIDTFTPAVLNGAYTGYDSLPAGGDIGLGRLHASFWQYQNKTYIAVINTAATDQIASIPLPSGATGQLKTLFPSDARYGNTLTLQNGQLIGSVPSNDTQVFVMDNVNTCTGDINQDGKVDLIDYSLLASNFLKNTFIPRADFNSDGKVNLIDYSILVVNFNKTCQ